MPCVRPLERLEIARRTAPVVEKETEATSAGHRRVPANLRPSPPWEDEPASLICQVFVNTTTNARFDNLHQVSNDPRIGMQHNTSAAETPQPVSSLLRESR